MIEGRVRVGRQLIMVATLLLLVGCSADEDGEYSNADVPASEGSSIVVPDLSGTAREGAELFTVNCSECHGPDAGGSSQGPPLVHSIYEPGHHADFSFHLAVSQGSRQHHWKFGDMEPVSGLSPEEVTKIVCYVRELQYANGVFTDPEGLIACHE